MCICTYIYIYIHTYTYVCIYMREARPDLHPLPQPLLAGGRTIDNNNDNNDK